MYFPSRRGPKKALTFRSISILAAVAALMGAPTATHALTQRTLLTATPPAPNEQFGASVASAGDFNGDGFEDFVVGAPYSNVMGVSSGRAAIYFGGSNPDPVADLLLKGAAGGALFGTTVAGGKDMDGDGYPDIAVGAPGSAAGKVYIFRGGPAASATPSATLSGVNLGDQFGVAVSFVGDVNGDGRADLLVGAPFNATGGTGAGQAYLFFGSPGLDVLPDIILTGQTAFDNFGAAVCGAGDLNADGYPDICVGAYRNPSGTPGTGRAYVYFGGTAVDAVADLSLVGSSVGEAFGKAIGAAGDVDGDGYDDLVVGAPNWPAGGQARIYHGGPALDAAPDVLLSSATFLSLGVLVGAAGDLDGDGHDDILVGSRSGTVGIFRGRPAGIVYSTSPDFLISGTNLSVPAAATGGLDINADGRVDVLVGDSAYFPGGGRAFLTTFFPFEIRDPNGGEQLVAGSRTLVHYTGTDLADLDLSLDGGSNWTPWAPEVGGGPGEHELILTVPEVASPQARLRVRLALQPATPANSDVSAGTFAIVPPPHLPAVAFRPAGTLTGAALEQNGSALAGVGDVNGDGFDDLLVGAPSPGVAPGQAYLLLGGVGADATPDLVLTGEASGDQFGAAVAGVGDLNRDGFADFAVGAPRSDGAGSDAGRAYVYFGAATLDAGVDLTLSGHAAGDNFGTAIAAAGDFNADGYADMMVSEPHNSQAGADYGRVCFYFGGATPNSQLDRTASGFAAGDLFGLGLASIGDVSGDGIDDVAVSAPRYETNVAAARRVFLYYGAGSGATVAASRNLTGFAVGDEFGTAIAAAGDVNGDGVGDLLVGAPGSDPAGATTGRALVYFGGPLLDATPELYLLGRTAGERFGYAVAGAGDLNGDGLADLLVGANTNSSGGFFAGRAYAVYGSAPAFSGASSLEVGGEAAVDQFGSAVASAGDMNGDGFADLAFGAPANDAGGTEAGRVYLFDANRYHLVAPNGGEVWTAGESATVAWAGAEPADLCLSVDDGATWLLLAGRVGGAAQNSVTVTVPGLPTTQARLRVRPSDPGLTGQDVSSTGFAIQGAASAVQLESLAATWEDGGGARLAWQYAGAGAPPTVRVEKRGRLGGESPWLVVARLSGAVSWHDADDDDGGRAYRLVAELRDGRTFPLGEVTLAARPTLRAWPLPFAGSVLHVEFEAPPAGVAAAPELILFDARGRRVRGFAVLPTDGTRQRQTWDGRDDVGKPVPVGVYFLRLDSGGRRHVARIIRSR